MKIKSYLFLGIGAVLLIAEYVFKLDDVVGYIITTLGTISSFFGILSIKSLREFFAKLFLNFL